MDKSNDTALFRANDVLVAFALLTRLPLPHAPDDAFERQAAATWAYPLVGAFVAVLAACVWGLAGWLGLSTSVQAGLALLTLVVATGALHEDGLADSADGLWGGHDRARRLEIMKDSRIGAYGVIALILILGLRWDALSGAGPWGLIAAAAVSRAVLPLMMHLLPQARDSGLARSVGGPSLQTAVIAFGFGAILAALSAGVGASLVALITAGLVAFGCSVLARTKIGGITGDILGATQVLCEVAILIAFAAMI